MKKIVSKVTKLLFLISSFALGGCSNGLNSTISNVHEVLPKSLSSQAETLSFSGVQSLSDLGISAEEYIAQVRKSSSEWNNDPISTPSVVVSPYYYFLTDDYVYGALVTDCIHSFVYVNYADTPVSLNIYSRDTIESIQLLSPDNPVQSQSKYDKRLSLTFNKTGTATFIINGDMTKPLTFFIEKPNTFDRNSYIDRTIKDYYAGTYDDPIIAKKNTAYYFHKGTYKIRRFELNDNVDLYFEDGCYIEVINPTEADYLNHKESQRVLDDLGQWQYDAFIKAWLHGSIVDYTHVKNVNVYGRSIIDMCKVAWRARRAFYSLVADNISVKDIMFANSSEWTYMILATDHAKLEQCKIFSYRQNSDGYAVCDSKDVRVEHCFARSGDDLFEVKSTVTEELFNEYTTQGIVFDYNTAWPDKCRGMGVIHETDRDITSIYFRNSVICAAPATWSEEMAPIVVSSGGKYGKRISDISFSNIQIYNNAQQPINVSLLSENIGGETLKSRSKIVSVLFENITYENNHKIRISNQGELPTSVINDIRFVNVKCGNSSISHDNLKVSGKMIGGIVVNP